MNERYNDFTRFRKTWNDLHDGLQPQIDALFVKKELDFRYIVLQLNFSVENRKI